MDEYIERGAVLDLLTNRNVAINPNDEVANIREDIECLPAADVRPVVKATWKRIDYKPCGHDYECYSCGWKNDMPTLFCPNCGAMMEES